MNKTDSLNIRKGAGTNHEIITSIPNSERTEYTATQKTTVNTNGKKHLWYFIEEIGGWGNSIYFTVLGDPATTSMTSFQPSPMTIARNVPNTPGASSGPNVGMSSISDSNPSNQGKGLDDAVADLIKQAMATKDGFDASTKLFGQPFQFTTSTDTRITGGAYPLGRKFVETIVSEAPIVYMLPGKANFLPSLNEDDRQAFAKLVDTKSSEIKQWALEDILQQESRYFDFLSDYTNYMRYVNLLCRGSAAFMGLDEYTLYEWSLHKYENGLKPTLETQKENDNLEAVVYDSEGERVNTLAPAGPTQHIKYFAKEIFEKGKDDFFGLREKSVDALMGTNYQYIQFYVDPSTSFQESSSTTTAPSQVAATLDKLGSMSKETRFLIDGAGGGAAAGTMANGLLNGVGNLAGMVAGSFGDGLASRFFQSLDTIIDGSNIAMPDIWGDSNYSKSYNISVNLVSPYGSKLAIYLHILVPLYHLLAFALPRQTSANGYAHPFMVRVSSKGWFNCEMGMVDNIQIEKVQGSYTVDGLPTEIRVNLSVRDLYSSLSIAPNTKPGLFFANSGLINWLAVTSGLDVTAPNFKEKWSAVLVVLTGRVVDIPGNIANSVLDSINNVIREFLSFR